MLTFYYVGLAYPVLWAILGPQDVDKVESTFFVPYFAHNRLG